MGPSRAELVAMALGGDRTDTERAVTTPRKSLMAAVTEDLDLDHLFELLRMLPGPAENREFWEEVAAHVNYGTQVSYIFQKLVSIGRAYRDRDSQHVEHLARYLLFFFAGNNPDLWKVLNTAAPHGVTALDAVRDALAGNPWLPPLLALA